MKRSTPEHPKFARLCKELRLPKYATAGILEMLWHFAAKFAVAGDVGRFDDESIAAALGWKKEAARMIDALVACGWLDRCAKHRLIIHDWADHADQTVRRVATAHKLALLSRGIADASTVLADAKQILDNDSQPLPLALAVSLSQEEPLSPSATVRAGKRATEMSAAFLAWWAAWPKHERKVGRSKCWDVWRRAGLDAKSEEIVAGLAADKASAGWQKDAGAYIPMPRTWLNQERWDGRDARASPEDRRAELAAKAQPSPEDAFKAIPADQRAHWLGEAKRQYPSLPPTVQRTAAVDLWRAVQETEKT